VIFDDPVASAPPLPPGRPVPGKYIIYLTEVKGKRSFLTLDEDWRWATRSSSKESSV